VVECTYQSRHPLALVPRTHGHRPERSGGPRCESSSHTATRGTLRIVRIREPENKQGSFARAATPCAPEQLPDSFQTSGCGRKRRTKRAGTCFATCFFPNEPKYCRFCQVFHSQSHILNLCANYRRTRRRDFELYDVKANSWSAATFGGLAGAAADVRSITTNSFQSSLFFSGSFFTSFTGNSTSGRSSSSVQEASVLVTLS
jgi:hypothetical protein